MVEGPRTSLRAGLRRAVEGTAGWETVGEATGDRGPVLARAVGVDTEPEARTVAGEPTMAACPVEGRDAFDPRSVDGAVDAGRRAGASLACPVDGDRAVVLSVADGNAPVLTRRTRTKTCSEGALPAATLAAAGEAIGGRWDSTGETVRASLRAVRDRLCPEVESSLRTLLSGGTLPVDVRAWASRDGETGSADPTMAELAGSVTRSLVAVTVVDAVRAGAVVEPARGDGARPNGRTLTPPPDAVTDLLGREEWRRLGALVPEWRARDGTDSRLAAAVVGRAYADLQDADGRRERGAYYTPPGVCDLLTRLVLDADDAQVLDPAAGTGRFLESAARRLESGAVTGVELREEPAGLARTVLSAREERQSRPDEGSDSAGGDVDWTVRVADFLDRSPADLGRFDAVLGNPPYVRHGDIDDLEGVRSHLGNLDATWLSRRCDLSVYFLTHATEFLREGGRMGLVVTDRWLDTRYGEDVARFVRQHYAVEAVIALGGAFPDSLVGACLLDLRREPSADRRRDTEATFLRLTGTRTVREVLDAVRGDETPEASEGTEAPTGTRQGTAANRGTEAGTNTEAGTRTGTERRTETGAGTNTEAGTRTRTETRTETGTETNTGPQFDAETRSPGYERTTVRQYRLEDEPAWRLFLDAPGTYLDLVSRPTVVELSEVASVAYGVKTGANDFFFGRMESFRDRGLGPYVTPALKATGQVESIPVDEGEAEQWAILDVHDLVERARRETDATGDGEDPENRVREWLADEDHGDLLAYVREGQREGYHERSSVAAREVWFDLGDLPRPRLLATMFTWRTHRVHWNAPGAVPSDQFYAVEPDPDVDPAVLGGLLNSRLAWLGSELLGREAGGEGMTRLQTKVYEAERWPVPDPRAMGPDERRRIADAFQELVAVERATSDTGTEAVARRRRALDEAVLGALALDRPVAAAVEAVERGVNERVADRRDGGGEKEAVIRRARREGPSGRDG